VVYVAFPNQVDRRYMEQLALSALVDICKSGVLKDSRAALRLAEMSEQEAASVLMGEDGSAKPENLLDDSILQAHGIAPAKLDGSVHERLKREGIHPTIAQFLSQGRFEEYLRALRKDGNLEPLYVPRDTKILDFSRGLLLNDIVNYLRAANFAGGYLFIDDIENLVDQMARKDRIEFAKEFALCTVRPGYANTTHNFFSSVLTTHQQASVSLSQAWGEAGLAAIARLDPGSPNSVELPFPSKDQGREIIIAHLDYFRVNKQELGSIKPFTEDGIEALLENRQTVHPRDLLARAANVMRYAVGKGVAFVDAECVKSAGESPGSLAMPDFTEGIEGAL